MLFSVGFILGLIRVFNAGAICFSARCFTRRFTASRRVDYLYSVLVALVILVAVGVSVVMALQGMSFRE